MIDYNYHTHTYRCGHAGGLDREYIENAISLGFKVLGFSDHILFESEEKEVFDDYIFSLTKLREEYKDKIKILIGFECEQLPGRTEYYKYLIKEKKVDYLILGQHYITDDDGKILSMFKEIKNSSDIARRYYESIKEGLKTGLYSYIAHPDLFAREYPCYDDSFYEYSRKICELAKEYNVPLEINLNGLKTIKERNIKNPHYPDLEFFKIAAEIGNDVIVGVDAHSPDFILSADYKWALDLIDKYKLHHVSEIKFPK